MTNADQTTAGTAGSGDVFDVDDPTHAPDGAENPGLPILRLTDVGKSYGNIHALRGVSLTVRQGEITCVLGDNGAGKSTLIKIMSGLHQHSEGKLEINGEEVHFTSPRQALDRRYRHGVPGSRAWWR